MDTKLDIGRQNAIQPTGFPSYDSSPFEASDLYCYLLEQAEQNFIPGTPEAICKLFENEFTNQGHLPNAFLELLKQQFSAAGLSDMPHHDDVKRDGAIRLFALEYTHAYIQQPQGLPDPRDATTSTTSQHLSSLQLLVRLIRRLLR